MELDDTALVEASLRGDERAFETLLLRYLRPVYTFVLSLTHDVPMAEDVTQETSVKAWQHLKRFDTSKNFKTWIFTIAKNTAYDALKKKRALPFSAFSEDEEESGDTWADRIADESPLPDELLVRADTVRIVESVLATLPEDFARILRLHYQEELSLQEIATVLGEPYNTIKSRHGRALAKLRQTFMERNASEIPKESYLQ